MSSSSEPNDSPPMTGVPAMLQNMVGPAFEVVSVVLPKAIEATKQAYKEFQKLPQNVLMFLYGCIVCFFGGTFPTLFAAIQAAKHGGRQAVAKAVSDITEEIMIVIEESKKDDEVDKDGDGKKDTKQLSPKELFKRKCLLVLRKMNPEKVDRALSSIYKVWMSVVAVLSLEFAKTISLALTIAESVQKPVDRFVAPTIRMATPVEYQKWIPVVLAWMVKSLAMSIAFYIQSILSATASALAGGLMMSRSMYDFCIAHDYTMMGLLPADHTKTYADEVFAYVFAALGFYTQFKSGFTLPTPLNLILWPFTIAEYYIRWTITRRTNQ